jgi:hypothetical protein
MVNMVKFKIEAPSCQPDPVSTMGRPGLGDFRTHKVSCMPHTSALFTTPQASMPRNTNLQDDADQIRDPPSTCRFEVSSFTSREPPNVALPIKMFQVSAIKLYQWSKGEQSRERSIYKFTFKDDTDATTIAAHQNKVCELIYDANAIKIVVDDVTGIDGLRHGYKRYIASVNTTTRGLLEALPEVKDVDPEQLPNQQQTPNSHPPSVDPNECTSWLFLFWEDISASTMAAHYDKVRVLTKRNDVITSTFGFDDNFKVMPHL